MSAIEITRQDLSISQLRAEAARTADAKQVRRILAIAMVLDGHARLLAAQACGMDRQTLRDWVIRYNEDGVAGLADRSRPGRPAALSDGQRAEVAQWVQSGPDRKTDGVVRWRCADLRDRIAAHFGIRMHERSVGKLLHALDFSSISVRPLHPQSDLEAQEAFKKTSPSWHAPRSRRSLPAGRLKSGFRMKRGSASKAR
jgi:transposase